ncbi:MAG: alpha/beta fold hydrolase [Pseudomonadota bacterium]
MAYRKQLLKAVLLLVAFSHGQSAAAECVILLHGLARTAKAMNTMETALVNEGFAVANIDYPSREHPIETLAPAAIAKGIAECGAKNDAPIHFVTHSMGGILVRYYLKHNSLPNLGRVVMLAPPNQGSEVVDNLAAIPGFSRFNGPAGLQLGKDANSVPLSLGPVGYPVGVIAGNKTFNPILSQFLPNPDDGKVSVARTKVEGMQDFLEVAVSHPFIMKDDVVISQVIAFLQTGSFRREKPIQNQPSKDDER